MGHRFHTYCPAIEMATFTVGSATAYTDLLFNQPTCLLISLHGFHLFKINVKNLPV